jgi:hypothetical protein
MTNPITPPPELVEQWVTEVWHEGTPARLSLSDMHITTEAARWGADQELEACCAWLAQSTSEPYINALRIARRPKPPSLKEQALDDAGGTAYTCWPSDSRSLSHHPPRTGGIAQ